jgi:hypothetical protein
MFKTFAKICEKQASSKEVFRNSDSTSGLGYMKKIVPEILGKSVTFNRFTRLYLSVAAGIAGCNYVRRFPDSTRAVCSGRVSGGS